MTATATATASGTVETPSRADAARTGGSELRLVDPTPLLAAATRHARIPGAGAAAGRVVLHGVLRSLEGGSVTLVDGARRRTYRSRTPDRYGRESLHAVLEIRDPRAYAALLRGSSGVGEAHRRGWFDSDDLVALLRLLGRVVRRVEPLRERAHRLARPVADPVRRLRGPDAGRDRDNIAAHYDLGNAFFELFLDETLTYSSGWFDRPDAPLEEASTAKLDRMCRDLDLRPGQRIVEIGTGWGSFALHAASRYGVHVTTTTLSAEQHRVATERVAAAGLTERVDVRLDHYRDIEGTYDALVAIEMIEAVDWRELDDFVSHCAELVGPSGAVGLQAIVVAPGRHSRARVSTDFIKSHVFPGGNLPSVPSILDAAARRTDLVPVALADFGMHYAETLRRWRRALVPRHGVAREMGLDDEFLRLWDFYLAYCEAGFEERQVSVVQMVLDRPGRARTLRPQISGTQTP